MDDLSCPRCGGSATWEECSSCGGDGYYDGYEDDPLWYEPGEIEMCEQCDGRGGWWLCLGHCWHEAYTPAALSAPDAGAEEPDA